MHDLSLPVDTAWKGLAPFQVLHDHVPMRGFRLLMQIRPREAERRALTRRRVVHGRVEASPLDPELGTWILRAGLSLARCEAVSFVYATPDEVLVLIKADAANQQGDSLWVHDLLVSSFSSRLSFLAGDELPAVGKIYEVADLEVARKAFGSVLRSQEDGALRRAVVGVLGYLQALDLTLPGPDELSTPEAEKAFLSRQSVHEAELPNWWRRGVVAWKPVVPGGSAQVEVRDVLPPAGELGTLIERV